jgi:hypothetical protein
VIKKKDIEKGQLVKLADDVSRWSDYVDTTQIGIILECYNSGEAKVLFQDGTINKLYWFSLEKVDEITRT